MLSEADAAFYEQRIENYKELLRQHYRDGERLKRALVTIQRAQWAGMPAERYCAKAPTALPEYVDVLLRARARSSLPVGRRPAPSLTAPDGRRLVTILNAARHVGKTRGRIYHWIREGYLHATGTPQRVYLDELERCAKDVWTRTA